MRATILLNNPGDQLGDQLGEVAKIL